MSGYGQTAGKRMVSELDQLHERYDSKGFGGAYI